MAGTTRYLTFEMPFLIVRVVVMGRDEDKEALVVGGLKEHLDVLDGIMFRNRFANNLFESKMCVL